jgi:hypothetical protein
MIHWYPYTGSNTGADGTMLLSYPGTKIPVMINGQTTGQDFGTSAGIKDSLAQWGLPNAQIMVTEFNYNGSLSANVATAANAEYVADSYATWLDNGITSVQYLELSSSAFLDSTSSLTRGSAFWAVDMLNLAENPGDSAVSTSSDTSTIRVHSYKRSDGTVAVMILNESQTAQTVNVNINGSLLASDGTLFSTTGAGITTTAATGLGNLFSVTNMPGRTIYTYIIPLLQIPGDYNDDGIVDAADYVVWRNAEGTTTQLPNDDDIGGTVGDAQYQLWRSHFGISNAVTGTSSLTHSPVPETSATVMAMFGMAWLSIARRRTKPSGSSADC